MTDTRDKEGWYVIQNAHRTGTRVTHGPLPKQEAARIAALATERASILHTPGLIHAITRDGMRVTWADNATPPQELEVATA